ncbi:MAG: tRNA pseudouridine(13) synthase TruD, partial [Myxococcales bacterium]|nr:tRNA pseudouridine(13) synthase TruD [Myxococcales bacterium]
MAPRDLDSLRRAALSPSRAHADLPGIGGCIRCRPEDFEVEELPAYGADGQPGHLLLTLRKRAMNSEDALLALSRALKVPRAEIGLAGLKDRDAVTTQWISLPQQALPRLASFSHPAITLGAPSPHSHKLRRGHLGGNRFCVVVRELQLDAGELAARVEAKLDHLGRVGLRNYYGEQRFGAGARNVAPGLASLAGKRRVKGKGDLVVSAGQSALFNLYLATRASRGQIDAVLAGDILQKRATGGLFECE